MTEKQRFEKLLKIAEEDPYYRTLRNAMAANDAPFHGFVNEQNTHIRNVLNTYTYAGRMMFQHLVRLAYTNMIFPDE